MRRWIACIVAALACTGCGGGPRARTGALIQAIDARDAEGAVALMVSSDQLAKLIACGAPSINTRWLTPESRRTTTDALLAEYRSPRPSLHVRLGPLFEDYDRASQWHAYRAGDVVWDDCRAKVPFSREVYRIVLILTEYDPAKPTDSTKPIELWNIDGKYYAWSDPMNTEGWH